MCIVERKGRCHKSSRHGTGNDKDESARNQNGVGVSRLPCQVKCLNTDEWCTRLPCRIIHAGILTDQWWCTRLPCKVT